MIQLNRKGKYGQWILCGDYLSYRKEGGSLSPLAWNHRIKELKKESAYDR